MTTLAENLVVKVNANFSGVATMRVATTIKGGIGVFARLRGVCAKTTKTALGLVEFNRNTIFSAMTFRVPMLGSAVKAEIVSTTPKGGTVGRAKLSNGIKTTKIGLGLYFIGLSQRLGQTTTQGSGNKITFYEFWS